MKLCWIGGLVLAAAAAHVLALIELPDQMQTYAPRLIPAIVSELLPPPLPAARPPKAAYWLDQNWREEDRRWFHHASQGTETFPIPYTWFVALEQPYIWLIGEPKLFKDSEYLQRFGFIPSPKTKASDEELRAFGFGKSAAPAAPIAPSTSLKWSASENDDGLPVGFARTKDPVDKTGGNDRIGLTCAACHTGHLEYGGVSLRIDGGPAMVDLDRLEPSLALALAYTLNVPHRFDRFAARVLPASASAAQRATLQSFLRATFAGIVADRGSQDAIMAVAQQRRTIEGNGRLDAINRIGNRVFYADMAKVQLANPGGNFHATDAPVSFPPIWTVPSFLWAQYDASIEHPLIRNAGEALGVAAGVDLASAKESPNLFRSSVDFANLLWIEDLLRGPSPFPGTAETKKFGGLAAPKWPSALFPDDPAWKIDMAKVVKGRALYAELCAGCHLGPVNDPEFDRLYPNKQFWTSKHWAPEGDQGGKALIPPQIPVQEIGTDRARADVLVNRMVETPEALDIDARRDISEKWSCEVTLPASETRTIPFAYALMVVVDRVADKWMNDKNVSAADRKAIIGWRKNCPNPDKDEVYRTRPLNGVWATAPYLHNGAVPSLYWLLRPAPERPQQFCFGARDFDPKVVGFAIDGEKPACAVGETLFAAKDAAGKAINGNSTAGHSFENSPRTQGSGVIGRGLNEDERFELIEYLKTL